MKDKVIVITGGSRGIGAGISRAFHARGCRIVINYRANDEAAEKLASTFNCSKDTVLLLKADTGTTQGRKRILDETVRHFGTLHVLVNNAGIAARGSFLKGSEGEFDAVINTNLKGPVFLAQMCANYMIEHEIRGSIVNLASVSAHMPNAAVSYAASKSGLVAATRGMALKLGKYGIRANIVTPGTIKSDMNRHLWQDKPELWDKHTRCMPLGRGGEPRELADAIVFLASEQSSFITGSELVVDGGWMLKPFW